jgi:Poly-beta-hydroxybutyrate polymerase (PhaC) N-terminus
MYLVDGSSPALETPSTASAFLTALARTPDLLDRGGALTGQVAAALAGCSTLEPGKGDRRFTDPAWSCHPLYRRLGRAYLAVERALSDAVEEADVDWPTRERARFAAGILASALSPTDTLAGKPQRAQARLRHRWPEPAAWRTQPAARPQEHQDAATG